MYRRYSMLLLLVTASNGPTPATALALPTGPVIKLNPTYPSPITPSTTISPYCEKTLYLVLVSLVIIIFLSSLFWYGRYKCMPLLTPYNTTLYLEVTSGRSCVYITLAKLPLCPSAYHFQASTSITGINVTHWWTRKRRLCFAWPDAHVQNFHTRVTTHIPTEIPITFHQW